jgi:hypothetical protein
MCDPCILLKDTKNEIKQLQTLVQLLRFNFIACHEQLMESDKETQHD